MILILYHMRELLVLFLHAKKLWNGVIFIPKYSSGKTVCRKQNKVSARVDEDGSDLCDCCLYFYPKSKVIMVLLFLGCCWGERWQICRASEDVKTSVTCAPASLQHFWISILRHSLSNMASWIFASTLRTYGSAGGRKLRKNTSGRMLSPANMWWRDTKKLRSASNFSNVHHRLTKAGWVVALHEICSK